VLHAHHALSNQKIVKCDEAEAPWPARGVLHHHHIAHSSKRAEVGKQLLGIDLGQPTHEDLARAWVRVVTASIPGTRADGEYLRHQLRHQLRLHPTGPTAIAIRRLESDDLALQRVLHAHHALSNQKIVKCDEAEAPWPARGVLHHHHIAHSSKRAEVGKQLLGIDLGQPTHEDLARAWVRVVAANITSTRADGEWHQLWLHPTQPKRLPLKLRHLSHL